MMSPLLAEIEALLCAVPLAPSRFGRDVLNDPRLVFDMRNGRQLKLANQIRVEAYLRSLREGEARVCSNR